MNMVGGIIPGKKTCYRIVGGDHGWHVTRPNAAMAHGFDSLADAVAFVRNDDSTAVVVEIFVDGVYMVKQIMPNG